MHELLLLCLLVCILYGEIYIKYIKCRSTFQNNANNNQQFEDMRLYKNIYFNFVDFTFAQSKLFSMCMCIRKRRTMDNQVIQ